MEINRDFKLYKIRHRSMMADLFEEHCCLLGKEVLDNVFVRDFLKMKEIPFVDKGKRYLRHHDWEPRGGVAKLIIGNRVESGLIGAIVHINYSRLRYEPYVVVQDPVDMFDNLDTVAEMVERALGWVYKTTDVRLKLEPWIPAKGEKIYWLRDCNEAHDNGASEGIIGIDTRLKLETCVNRIVKKHMMKQEAAPPKTTRKKSRFSSFILKGNKRKIMKYLHNKIDELGEPKLMMRVILAAIAAGVLDKDVEFMFFQNEFKKEGLISKTSYNDYVRNKDSLFLDDSMFEKYKMELMGMV